MDNRNRAEEARQRWLAQQVQADSPPQADNVEEVIREEKTPHRRFNPFGLLRGVGSFAGRTGSSAGSWVLRNAMAFILIAVVAWLVIFAVRGWTTAPIAIQSEGPGGLHVVISLLHVGLISLLILSLVESADRSDPLLLDFFSAWATVITLILGQVYGIAWWFWLLLGASLFAMVIGTFYNPAEEDDPNPINRIDTTNWFVAGVALILIYLLKSSTIPYPAYLPIMVPVLVAFIGAAKEFFRQPLFSLIIVAIGLVPAFLQTPVWLLLGLIAAILFAASGLQQGWVTSRSVQHGITIGGRRLEYFLAWDFVLFYVAEVILIGYALYQNYTVWVIGQ